MSSWYALQSVIPEKPGARKPHRAMYEGCGAIGNWRMVR